MSWFSPKMPPAPEKREADPFAIVSCGRAFSAAEVSAKLGPWIFDGGFSNSEIGATLSTVRSRSRDMDKNSEYFHRWIQLWVANIVGPNGFRFKSAAEMSDSDMSPDKDAAYFLETAWTRWASDRRAADVAGQLDLAGILRLAAENWARDGEAFILIDRHAQNRFGISLRVIRPDCCDETINRSVDETRSVRLGVEIESATGRPLAYYFDTAKEDPNSHYFGGKPRMRLPARDVIHLFTPRDAMQVRGFPLGHAALKKLKMLDEYDNSELIAARDEVNTLGVFTAPLGREQEIKSLAKDDKVRNRLEMPSEPGQRVILTQGWNYQAVHPNHPNAGLPQFKESMLRDVASGLGVEYANFANCWAGVSYSSVRAGTLSERDQWMTHQAVMISRVMEPIFEAWLESFLALAASGRYSPADLPRLSPHQFRGRRWDWVDPLKDVNASVVAVAHGWKTDADIAADYGGDIDDNLAEAARIKPVKDALALATVESYMQPGDTGGAADAKEMNESEKEQLSNEAV